MTSNLVGSESSLDAWVFTSLKAQGVSSGSEASKSKLSVFPLLRSPSPFVAV